MDEQTSGPSGNRAGPHRVRLPGFISDEPIGLGDVVKRATSAVGIKPCAPCAKRAERLNGWLVLTGRKR
jgi:hypothetical protein